MAVIDVSIPSLQSRAQAEDLENALVGMSDVDGLKTFNDNFGYAAGDKLLRAKADALRQVGVEAYHDKGDEFLYRAQDGTDLRAKLDRAREILHADQVVFLERLLEKVPRSQSN